MNWRRHHPLFIFLMGLSFVVTMSLACEGTGAEGFQAVDEVRENVYGDDESAEDAEDKPPQEIVDDAPEDDGSVPGDELIEEDPDPEDEVSGEEQPDFIMGGSGEDCIAFGADGDCIGGGVSQASATDTGLGWIFGIAAPEGTDLASAEICFFFNLDNNEATGLSGADIFGAETVSCTDPGEPIQMRYFSGGGDFIGEDVAPDGAFAIIDGPMASFEFPHAVLDPDGSETRKFTLRIRVNDPQAGTQYVDPPADEWDLVVFP